MGGRSTRPAAQLAPCKPLDPASWTLYRVAPWQVPCRKLHVSYTPASSQVHPRFTPASLIRPLLAATPQGCRAGFYKVSLGGDLVSVGSGDLGQGRAPARGTRSAAKRSRAAPKPLLRSDSNSSGSSLGPLSPPGGGAAEGGVAQEAGQQLPEEEQQCMKQEQLQGSCQASADSAPCPDATDQRAAKRAKTGAATAQQLPAGAPQLPAAGGRAAEPPLWACCDACNKWRRLPAGSLVGGVSALGCQVSVNHGFFSVGFAGRHGPVAASWYLVLLAAPCTAYWTGLGLHVQADMDPSADWYCWLHPLPEWRSCAMPAERMDHCPENCHLTECAGMWGVACVGQRVACGMWRVHNKSLLRQPASARTQQAPHSLLATTFPPPVLPSHNCPPPPVFRLCAHLRRAAARRPRQREPLCDPDGLPPRASRPRTQLLPAPRVAGQAAARGAGGGRPVCASRCQVPGSWLW